MVSDKFKANVLFVNLPSVTYHDLEKSLLLDGGGASSVQLHGEPLGILYLSATLKDKQVVKDVWCLDIALGLMNVTQALSVYQFITEAAKRHVSANKRVDVIGLSSNFSCQHRVLLLTAKILRELHPNAIVCAGGFHPTNATKEVLADGSVDLVFRGESEISFVEFIDTYNTYQSPSLIDSLQFRLPSGVYSKRKLLLSISSPEISLSARVPYSPRGLESPEIPSELDKIPLPDRSIVDMAKYTSNEGRTTVIDKVYSRKKASIITNRGCYFSCSFCASRTIFPRKMRFRSLENIKSELYDLYEKYGVNFFVIEDDLFTADKDLCVGFLRMLSTLRIPDLEIQFPNDLNINTLDRDIIDAMVDAGLRVAHLAIESGSPYIQKHVINKGVRLELVPEHVAYFRSLGVIVKSIFILGFPGESISQMEETISFARAIDSDWSIFNIATPLLGTPMCQQFIDLGYIADDITILSETDFKRRMFDTREISANDLNRLQYRANLDLNFVNNRLIRENNFQEALGVFSNVYKKYPYHAFALWQLYKCELALGTFQNAQRLHDDLSRLLTTDSRAINMVSEFGDLLPELAAFLDSGHFESRAVYQDNYMADELSD